MARYQKGNGFNWITLLILLLFSFNLSANNSYKEIDLVGYLKDYDRDKIENVSKERKYIFINLDLNGGKLEFTFNIIDEIIKQQKLGRKFHIIVDKNSNAFASSFLILLVSDIVFYFTPLNLGASSILSKKTYNRYKDRFDNLFHYISTKNGIDESLIKNFFFNGKLFNLKGLTQKTGTKKGVKFIKIEELEDVTYSFNTYKVNSNSNIISYLYSFEFIFIILNFAIILTFISVYFTKRNIIKFFAIILIIGFVYLSVNVPINFHSLFAIIFVHFILMFRNFINLKYILFIAALSIFVLSSILFFDPFNSEFYLDQYGINIFVIIVIFFINITIYKIGYLFFFKRLKNFNKSKNDLLNVNGSVTSLNPLKVLINNSLFNAYSFDKLDINSRVKVVSLKKLDIVVEKIPDNK